MLIGGARSHVAILAAEVAAQIRRQPWDFCGIPGKGRKLTDVHEEVPGRPHLLYLLSGFLPHEQGEGGRSGETGLHVGDLSTIIVRGTNAASSFLSDFFPDGDGEETDCVWDTVLEIVFVALYCPVRPGFPSCKASCTSPGKPNFLTSLQELNFGLCGLLLRERKQLAPISSGKEE